MKRRLGLYELFVGDLDMPEWLTVHSLDDVKKSVADVLAVFVSVKGIEVLLREDAASDALRSVGAAGILVVALSPTPCPR